MPRLSGCRQWNLGVFALMVLLVQATLSPAFAVGLIRDAETEYLIRSYSEPIFAAAGLDPKAVRIYIVNDSRINAFVTGGQRMFIHTGLIMASDNPNMVTGVIAHETGHIAGGHLSRSQEAIANAQIPMLLSVVLGAAAIAAGQGEAGAAVMAGGQAVGQRSFLSYSRVQEASADQAAVTYLDRVGISGRGLVETMELFAGQELLSGRQQDEYVRSHPLSRNRVNSLIDRVEKSPYREVRNSPAEQHAYDMMKAKLHGFLERPTTTFRRFPETDLSLPAQYARAIALFKLSRTQESVAAMDRMIAIEPNNPFLREFKGQALFESGYVREAITPYEEAVNLRPDSAMIRVGLARAMISTEDMALNEVAMRHLQTSLQYDRENSMAFHQLAITYARAGKKGLAELATAERFYLQGRMRQAKSHAARAQRDFRENSPNWLRAEDIIQAQ